MFIFRDIFRGRHVTQKTINNSNGKDAACPAPAPKNQSAAWEQLGNQT